MHRGTGTRRLGRDQNGRRGEEDEKGATRGRGQPPVLILIENASVEKVARAHVYVLRARVRVYEHRYRCNHPRRPEAARERQRPGKRPRGTRG